MRALSRLSNAKQPLLLFLLLVAVGLATIPASPDSRPWLRLLAIVAALPFLWLPAFSLRFGGWGLSIFMLLLLSQPTDLRSSLAWQTTVFTLALLTCSISPRDQLPVWRPATMTATAACASHLLPPSDVNY